MLRRDEFGAGVHRRGVQLAGGHGLTQRSGRDRRGCPPISATTRRGGQAAPQGPARRRRPAAPRRHVHHLKSARSAAKRGCGKLLECSMFREAQVVVWRYGKAAEPSTVERKHGRWKAVSAAAAIVVVVIGAMLTWHRWDAGQGESDAKTTRAPSTFPSPAALPPAPEPANAAPALPSVGDQPVDPASTGPAEGLLCTHAQLNNTTIANSRSIVHQFEPTTASPRNLFGSSPGSVPLG